MKERLEEIRESYYYVERVRRVFEGKKLGLEKSEVTRS